MSNMYDLDIVSPEEDDRALPHMPGGLYDLDIVSPEEDDRALPHMPGMHGPPGRELQHQAPQQIEVVIEESVHRTAHVVSAKKSNLWKRSRESMREKLALSWSVGRGRARRLIRRFDTTSVVISCVYLVLIFGQMVLEELPLDDDLLDEILVYFSWIDLVFLSFFAFEILAHLLADGMEYFTKSKLYMVDAVTILASFVLALLVVLGLISVRLEIFRLFRILRIVKVAIALQRVRTRTGKWRKLSTDMMRSPPTCNWAKAKRYIDGVKLEKPEKKFAAFLTHYKLESGADARYLEQQLEAMLKVNIFVDSNDLTDLNEIFDKGVHQSEMIILLGTAGVLTRPWCLLELYEARKRGTPVLTFALAGHVFTPDKARAQLASLETTLPANAVQLIKDHLAEAGDTWERFHELLIDAVDPTGGDVGPPLYQVWHSMGADAQVNLEIQGLISSMALVTHRSLQWSEDDAPTTTIDDGPQFDLRDYLCCRRQKTGKMYSVYIALAHEGIAAARVLQSGLREELNRPVRIGGNWGGMLSEPDPRAAAPPPLVAVGSMRGLAAEIEHRAATAATRPSPTKPASGELQRSPSRVQGLKRQATNTLRAHFGHHDGHQSGPRHHTKEEFEKAAERVEDAVDHGVLQSTSMIVLLTKHLLECPWTLLEIYYALHHDVPVVPVMLEGSGYDFGAAPNHIANFGSELEARDPDLYRFVVEVFAHRGVSINQMQQTLKKLPNLIAVSMRVNTAPGTSRYTGACEPSCSNSRTSQRAVEPVDYTLKGCIAAIATRVDPP